MRIFISIILIAPLVSQAQSKCDCFDRLYNLANSNYYLKEDDTVGSTMHYIDIMKDAVSFLDAAQAGEYYPEIANAYNLIKQYDSAVSYYTKAVEWGYDIENIPAEVFVKMDTTRLKKIVLEQREKMDFKLYDLFIQQGALDQCIRDGTLFPESEIGSSAIPPCKKSFIDSAFYSIDNSTFEFVRYVLENYQYPTQHQLGFLPYDFNVFLLHITAQDNKNSRYVFEKLEELNKTCNLPDKSRILFYKERQKYYKDRKSYCGMIGVNQFFTIEDICKADSIRFIYNQVRLKEQAAGSNRELPKEYKPIPYPENYFCLKKYQLQ